MLVQTPAYKAKVLAAGWYLLSAVSEHHHLTTLCVSLMSMSVLAESIQWACLLCTTHVRFSEYRRVADLPRAVVCRQPCSDMQPCTLQCSIEVGMQQAQGRRLRDLPQPVTCQQRHLCSSKCIGAQMTAGQPLHMQDQNMSCMPCSMS